MVVFCNGSTTFVRKLSYGLNVIIALVFIVKLETTKSASLTLLKSDETNSGSSLKGVEKYSKP
jgi:hypothetical protein